MKKELVTTTIALHPLQVAIIKGLQSGKINLERDSLRGIAKIIGVKENHPQSVQHHISQLVKLGVIQIIHSQHTYFKTK